MRYEKRTLNSLEERKNFFHLVRASSLSLDDQTLKYIPKTYEQKEFKKLAIEAIESKIPDFMAQTMDPCFLNGKGMRFGYRKGEIAAVGLSANTWNELALNFCPEKRSRIGNVYERVIFLFFIMNYLIKTAKVKEDLAWEYICNNSTPIAYYRDSRCYKGKRCSTGNTKVGIWYDLGNTFKIVSNEDKDGYFLMGGCCFYNGDFFPLANIGQILSIKERLCDATAWIVTDP